MAYIGKAPSGTGVRIRYYFTQTSGGATSISGTDDNNKTLSFSDGEYVDVYLNGVSLVAGTDYNTTTANTIGGLSALANGDVVEVVVYDIFTVADTVSQSSGGTFSGAVIMSNGLTVDDDGATVLTVDRATSDGTVIDIQKDGSSVGTIDSQSGTDISIGSGSVKVRFFDTDNQVMPTTDDHVILGRSDSRYKDLFLSGDIYLGGTGSSNALSDYEEGTWTPVVAFGGGTSGITYGTQFGRYVKIGELVMLQCTISMSSKGSSSGAARIQGMPFNQGGTGFHCTGMQMFNFTGGTEYVVAQTAGGSNEVAVIRMGADQSLDDSDFANNTGIRFSIVYRI